MSKLRYFAAAVSAAAFFSGQLCAAAGVDPNLPEYSSISGVAGTVSGAGSVTMTELMSGWADAFTHLYPDVKVQLQTSGSAAAASALAEGNASLGVMSRKMNAAEVTAFESKFGYKPVAIPVALDAVTIYVHKDNPIKGLTLPQLDAIFSTTRKCGFAAEVTEWAQLGVEGSLGGKNIQPYGRAAPSGSRDFFTERALCGGDFLGTLIEQADDASVVQSVAGDISGIGYAGMGHRMSGVRAVPLARKKGQAYEDGLATGVLTGKYPLSRFLYIYLNKPPGKPASPLVREFLRMVLSKTGQDVVVGKRYIPLPANLVNRELGKLD